MKKWRREAEKSNLEQGRKHTGRANRQAAMLAPLIQRQLQQLMPSQLAQLQTMDTTTEQSANEE
jgi:hypothetical protein